MPANTIFEENSWIDHDGHPLFIEKLLSSGLTGEVYRGRLTLPEADQPLLVAVKVMKALDFPLARQLFYKEGETLSFLMHLEEETSDALLETPLKIAPRYYGLSEYRPNPESAGIPYIVMEFIQGRQVPELIRENGAFSEKEALVMGWHLYRMLDILHTRLNKTFIDLKFENLWWVTTQDKWGGQLRLTDFGTLEDFKPGQQRGVSRDLLLGGVYLLAMLTTKILAYSLGELREPAEPVIKHYADRMTWGTRRLLFKLLHRNPDVRPKSAAEVVNKLRLLASFWSQAEEQLQKRALRDLTIAEAEMEKARGQSAALSQAGVDAATRALAALDILRLRAPHLYKESDAERARTVLAFGDYFERGLALLQGRSFQLARQTFEEGMKWAEDPAPLRRWAYVAQIGEEIPPADFEKRFPELKSLLDFINDPAPNPARWASARRDIAALAEKQGEDKPSLRSKGLDALLTECDLYENYEQAQRKYVEEDFEAAAELYGKVETLLKSLPADVRRLIEEETGAVSAQRRNAEMRKARQDAKEEYAGALSALQAGDCETAIRRVREAYALYRPVSDHKFHLEHLTALIEIAFAQARVRPEQAEMYLQTARDFAETGWYDTLAAPEAGRIVRAALDLSALERALQDFDAARYLDLLSNFHQDWGEGENAPTEVLASIAARRAETAREDVFLMQLAEAIERQIPGSSLPQECRAKAEQIRAEKDRSLQQQIDALLQSVHQILLPVLPDPQNPQTLEEIFRLVAETAKDAPAFDLLALGEKRSRLEAARESLASAARLLGDRGTYRREEIERLCQAVESALQSVSNAETTQVQILREQRAARLKSLSAERLHLSKKLKWALQAPEGTPQSTREALYAELRGEISDFLYRCYLAEGLEPENLQQSLTSQRYAEATATEAISLAVLREWAIKALNALGGESWNQVAEFASKQAQTLQTWYAQAHRAFEEGKLATLAAELDRTQKEYGTTPEWQSLKEMLAQAQAWQAWCQARQAQFASAQLDENLLRDLRAFSSIGLPAIYWDQSPAPTYLDSLWKALEAELRARFHDPYHTPQFVETLRALLNVSWTKSLAAQGTGKAPTRAWNAGTWLQNAYLFTVRKDPRGLLNFIAQTPPPEAIEDALRSLTYADWLALRQEDEKRLQEEAKRKPVLKNMAFGAMTLVFLCLLLFGVYQLNRNWANQKIYGTYTPTASLTPSITPTPTDTPIPSPTPTEPPTATPIPTSALLLADSQALYPPVPLTGDAYWVLDETHATLQPAQLEPGSPWQKGFSGDPKAMDKTFIYANKGSVSVTWSMDTPFDADGFYAIYVLDPSYQSSGPQSFQVLLDGVEVPTYRGSPNVIFLNYGESKVTDRWLPLGVYSIAQGQSLSVKVTTGELTANAPFAVDRLLIVRINEPTRQMLELLPAGRTLVSLLDNPQATFYQVGARLLDQGLTFRDTLAWNGDFVSKNLGPTGERAPVWVDWEALNRLPAGEYEVYVWIPAQHATAAGEYILLVDGKPFKRDNPATVNQNDYHGEWVTLGTWRLDREALVGLRFQVEKGIPGEIGVDAVAIVSTGR